MEKLIGYFNVFDAPTNYLRFGQRCESLAEATKLDDTQKRLGTLKITLIDGHLFADAFDKDGTL